MFVPEDGLIGVVIKQDEIRTPAESFTLDDQPSRAPSGVADQWVLSKRSAISPVVVRHPWGGSKSMSNMHYPV